jgi:hypothetical protein
MTEYAVLLDFGPSTSSHNAYGVVEADSREEAVRAVESSLLVKEYRAITRRRVIETDDMEEFYD